VSAARLLVRAVLVTDGRTRHLPATFHALEAQEVAPDILHIVTIGDIDLPEIPARLRATVSRSDATTYSAAVDEVLAEHRPLPHEYLWLLHDDTAPLPNTLGTLSATARKRARAGVIGAAHVRWDDPNRLVNLGTTVSRVGARRITLVEEDDVNQGQYHERDDVLAVSIGAALVRRDVWEHLGGLDPAYEGFGDSTDFCRRAWRAGHDVVIVPAARVRHAQDGLYGRRESSARGRRSTYIARRTSEWYHALAWSPPWAMALLILWACVSAPLRVLGRIAQNEPRLALDDIAVPWQVMRRSRHVKESRASIARTSTVKPQVVRPLLASMRTIVDHVRARELGAYEQRRAYRMPTDVVRAELAAVAGQRRRAFALVAFMATAASVVVFGRLIPGLVSGLMPTSPALGATQLSTSELWTRAWTGWSEAGFGVPALDGTFAALMLPLSMLPGGLPVGIGLLLALSVVWATLAAWAAAGAATRSVWARGAIALTYGLWPLFLESVTQGRVGAVIAHIVLPLFFLGVARAVGWQRGEIIGDGEEHPARRVGSPSAGLGAAIALATVSVAAPVLLAPLVLVSLVAGVFAGKHRWRAWTTALPALVLAGPALMAWLGAGPGTAGSWWILARENGPALSVGEFDEWRLALGTASAQPLAGGSWAAFATVGVGVVVLVLAAVSLASRRGAWAIASGWVIAAIGWATAVVSGSMVVVWADSAGAPSAHGWPGAGSSLMAVGLLGAVAVATHRTGVTPSGQPLTGMQVFRARAVLVAGASVTALALTGHVAAVAWPTSHVAANRVTMVSPHVLPLVASLEQEVRSSQRVLVLSHDDGGTVWFSVLARDGSEGVSGRAHVDSRGVPLAHSGEASAASRTFQLVDTVAELATSGTEVSEFLAAWGIGVIVVPVDSPAIQSALQQIPELTLMGASDLGISWRVSRPGQDVPVSRAWFVSSDGAATVLPMVGASIDQQVTSSQPGAVVVAETADDRWVATLDGEPLQRVNDVLGRNVFALPAGSGHLDVAYRDPEYRLWWWLGVVAVAWSLLGAIPVQSQRHREEDA